MSKYQEIFTRYKQSGLTQKSFAEKEGMSIGMVGYYLRRARQEQNDVSNQSFEPIQITSPNDSERCIRITTSKGLQITIPI